MWSATSLVATAFKRQYGGKGFVGRLNVSIKNISGVFSADAAASAAEADVGVIVAEEAATASVVDERVVAGVTVKGVVTSADTDGQRAGFFQRHGGEEISSALPGDQSVASKSTCRAVRSKDGRFIAVIMYE